MRSSAADGAPPPHAHAHVVDALRAAVEERVRGKRAAVELVLVAALAGGHVLLEDVPGVGKTTLAQALAAAVGGSFRRIQFTSDLLPADLVGVQVLEPGSARFTFRPGPVFANVVLADEVNRTSPRTQSALLEAMSEQRVTVDGATHELPDPFLVVATQNPYEHAGTFPLPDSQLDRFLLRIALGYPDREAERAVLRGLPLPRVEPVVQQEGLRALRTAAMQVAVQGRLEDLVLDLVQATRRDGRFLRGASTRGAEALYRAVKAHAFVKGRDFAVPEDLHAVAVPVLAHRVIARSDQVDAAARAVQEVLWSLPAAGR